jgi:hypothetical protein
MLHTIQQNKKSCGNLEQYEGWPIMLELNNQTNIHVNNVSLEVFSCRAEEIQGTMQNRITTHKKRQRKGSTAHLGRTTFKNSNI